MGIAPVKCDGWFTGPVVLIVSKKFDGTEMKKQWIIRKAVIEDAAGLKNVMESAYSAYQERMGGKRLPPMEVDYFSEIRDYPTWVVESNGTVVAGLIMMFEDNFASIANIAVHPDFQGRGLGGSLMKFAETVAKEEAYPELRLATHVMLTENLSLYDHLGWLEIERDDVRVYMRKEICP